MSRPKQPRPNLHIQKYDRAHSERWQASPTTEADATLKSFCCNRVGEPSGAQSTRAEPAMLVKQWEEVSRISQTLPWTGHHGKLATLIELHHNVSGYRTRSPLHTKSSHPQSQPSLLQRTLVPHSCLCTQTPPTAGWSLPSASPHRHTHFCCPSAPHPVLSNPHTFLHSHMRLTSIFKHTQPKACQYTHRQEHTYAHTHIRCTRGSLH